MGTARMKYEKATEEGKKGGNMEKITGGNHKKNPDGLTVVQANRKPGWRLPEAVDELPLI